MKELLDKLFPEPEGIDGHIMFGEDPASSVEFIERPNYLPPEVVFEINKTCKYDWQGEPFDLGDDSS